MTDEHEDKARVLSDYELSDYERSETYQMQEQSIKELCDEIDRLRRQCADYERRISLVHKIALEAIQRWADNDENAKCAAEIAALEKELDQ